MPQVDHSIDHYAYRCYRQGPDGFRALSICEPGAQREATPAGGTQSTSKLADPPRVWKMSELRLSTWDQIDCNRVELRRVNSCEPSPSSLGLTDYGALHLPPLFPRDRLSVSPQAPLRAPLDFNEREFSPPVNHEADLHISPPPVPIQDLPIPISKRCCSVILSPLLPLSCPAPVSVRCHFSPGTKIPESALHISITSPSSASFTAPQNPSERMRSVSPSRSTCG